MSQFSIYSLQRLVLELDALHGLMVASHGPQMMGTMMKHTEERELVFAVQVEEIPA